MSSGAFDGGRDGRERTSLIGKQSSEEGSVEVI